MLLGSNILEVAIALFFIYFLGSVIVSHVNELIAGFLQLRAKQLKMAILELVVDPALGQKVLANPLVTTLCSNKTPFFARRARKIEDKKRAPSYIPARVFATALLNEIATGNGNNLIPETAAGIRQNIQAATIDSKLKEILLNVVEVGTAKAEAAQTELERAINSIEAWYDAKMDRARGAYKRLMYWFLLPLSLLVAVGFNIDTLYVTQALSKDSVLRQALVAEAGKANSNTDYTQAVNNLGSLSQIVGWPDFSLKECSSSSPSPSELPCHRKIDWLSAIFGWIISGLAFSLGAPFWFDLLNNIVNLRSSGQPPASTTSNKSS